MNALVTTIKNHIKGRVTILLAERAHIRTLNLEYNNFERVFEKCLHDANLLHHRFKDYFIDCDVAYWHHYICNDSTFSESHQAIQYLYEHDSLFKHHLYADAEASYVIREKHQDIVDKQQFINNTIEDIIEQCVCIIVLSKKGYRFQFYPGQSYASTEYVNQKLLSNKNRINWINVFISIENKTFLENDQGRLCDHITKV